MSGMVGPPVGSVKRVRAAPQWRIENHTHLSVAIQSAGQYPAHELLEIVFASMKKYLWTALIGLLVAPVAAEEATNTAPSEWSVPEAETIVLSDLSAHARSATISSRGPMTGIVWVESVLGEGPVIQLLRLTDSTSQAGDPSLIKESIVTATNGASVYGLGVAISPIDGTSSVVWIESDAQGSRLYVKNGQDDATVLRETRHLLDFPAIDYDDEGNCFVAWSEQIGGSSRVSLASKIADEDWTSTTLSFLDQPYDLLPHVFANRNGADVYWFAIDGSDVAACHSLVTDGKVESAGVFSLHPIPAFRLPVLYPVGSENRLGALWLEPSEQGDLYFRLSSTDNDFAFPELIGTLTGLPIAASISQEGTATIAWIERNSDGGRSLIAESGDGRELIRHSVSSTASEPLVAVSDLFSNLAWIEEDPVTGQKSLLFLRTR